MTRSQTLKSTVTGVKALNDWGDARKSSENAKDEVDLILETTEGDCTIYKLLNMENEERLVVLKEFVAEVKNKKTGKSLSACTKNNYLDSIQRFVNQKSSTKFYYREDVDFTSLRKTVENYEVAEYVSSDSRKIRNYSMDPFDEDEVICLLNTVKYLIEIATNDYEKLMLKMDFVVLGLGIFCELRSNDLSKIESNDFIVIKLKKQVCFAVSY